MKYKKTCVADLRKNLASVLSDVFYKETEYIISKHDTPFVKIVKLSDEEMEEFDKKFDEN